MKPQRAETWALDASVLLSFSYFLSIFHDVLSDLSFTDCSLLGPDMEIVGDDDVEYTYLLQHYLREDTVAWVARNTTHCFHFVALRLCNVRYNTPSHRANTTTQQTHHHNS
jgi:hypothetical protein